jgi:GNAT superfamily N-acetyltransferase
MRPFRPEDADFCFRVRSRTFIVDFREELAPEVVAICVNAYMPADYVRMAEEKEVFVVECGGTPAGFFALRQLDAGTAELALIYLDHRQRGRGVGSWCLESIERWVRKKWPGTEKLLVETVIPESSGGFYRKLGFRRAGTAVSNIGGSEVPAVLFAKELELAGPSE